MLSNLFELGGLCPGILYIYIHIYSSFYGLLRADSTDDATKNMSQEESLRGLERGSMGSHSSRAVSSSSFRRAASSSSF